jgi:hypothetical protein
MLLLFELWQKFWKLPLRIQTQRNNDLRHGRKGDNQKREKSRGVCVRPE